MGRFFKWPLSSGWHILRACRIRRLKKDSSLTNSLHNLLLIIAAFIGAFLRFFELKNFPYGLHGDEAWTGIRAEFIHYNGWIGFFDSTHSIGQWALPEYATVPFLAINDPILIVRLPSAIAGTLSLIFFYLFLRNTLSKWPALFGLCMLAIFPVHILLSRVGFPPMMGFFFFSAGLWSFSKAAISVQRNARREKLLWSAMAGVLCALGSISYGAIPVVTVPLFLGLGMVPSSFGKNLRERFTPFLTAIVGAAAILIPVMFAEISNGSLFSRSVDALGKKESASFGTYYSLLKGIVLAKSP